jgi:uncharacterized protein with ParB-like and HNH nuclease domain
MKKIIETSTPNFTEIMGNSKKYSVPPFQRDYSWKEEHWDDIIFSYEYKDKNQ